MLSIEGPGSSVAELLVSKQDFQTHCLDYPQVTLKVLRVVGARLRRLVSHRGTLVYNRTTPARFVPLRLAQSQGKHTAEGVEDGRSGIAHDLKALEAEPLSTE